jgi:drug/metabolite transporter (DMT)-like permease
MKPQSHPLRGYLFIASATLLWGVAASLGRAAFTGRLPWVGNLSAIDPLILSQSRTSLSFLVLLPVLGAMRGWGTLKLPKGDLAKCCLLGVLGVAASNYFYYVAIQKTNVATAILLQYTAPVWVLLYMVARGLQKASARRVAAVVLAVAGCGLAIGVAGGSGFRLDWLGVTAAILASYSYAFYNIGGHGLLSRYDRWTVLLWTLGSAAAFWVFVNPPWKLASQHFTGPQVGFLVVFALVSVLAPFSLYFAGLQHLEPTKAIIGSCLEPVFSILIAAIALGEVMRPIQALGMVAVLVAIVLIQLPERMDREELAVEPIE